MPVNDLTPAQRSLWGRIGANERWSRTAPADRPAGTKAARDARWARYLAAVPESVTDPEERARLAAQARRADMQRLAIASARARAAKKAGR